MEKMKQPEITAAAHRILGYLEVHGDTPILAMKDELKNPEVQFYMGLGDLILQRQVTLQERQGAFWVSTKSKSGQSV